MEQIKLKTFTAETLELLEKNINAFKVLKKLQI